jgi:hypothetical protein
VRLGLGIWLADDSLCCRQGKGAVVRKKESWGFGTKPSGIVLFERGGGRRVSLQRGEADRVGSYYGC